MFASQVHSSMHVCTGAYQVCNGHSEQAVGSTVSGVAGAVGVEVIAREGGVRAKGVLVV